MTWKEGLIGIPLAVLGALIALLTVAAMGLTRTDWGREQLRAFALEELNSSIRGRVEIGAVAGGDLLRGVRAGGIRIYGPDGELFASADSLAVRYRWWDFLGGDIVLSSVRLVRPMARLHQSPGGEWNVAAVFESRAPGTPEAQPGRGGQKQIVLEEVSIQSGDVSLRIPRPPEFAAELTTDTIPLQPGIQWRGEILDGQPYQLISVTGFSTRMPVARIIARPPARQLIQIDRFVGQVSLLEEPFDVRELRADVEWSGDSLWFELFELELPGSRLFGRGEVSLGEETRYDVSLRGDPVVASDLQWLEPRLPPDGRARLDFRIFTSAEGLSLEATDALWVSGDARLTGRLGLVLTEGPLEFRDLRLEIDRLPTSLIETFAQWEAPFNGMLSGRVALDGVPEELRVDLDLRLEDDEGVEPPARFGATGIVFAQADGFGGRELRVRLDTLPLQLVRAFAPAVTVEGSLHGSGDLNGRLSTGLRVGFRLEHRHPALAASRFQGEARLEKNGERPLAIDLEAAVAPLSLNTLAEFYPGIPFRGNLTGDIRAQGSLADWTVRARLGGTGDSLWIDAGLRLAEDPPAYRGTIEGRRVKLATLREGLPQSDLDFRVEFEARGTDVEEVTGRAHVDLFSSFVGGVRLDSSFADLRMDRGRLVVDTLSLAAEFGSLRAAGALDLTQASSDSLAFELDADSLGGLNPWLVPAAERFGGPTVTGNGAGGLTSDTDDGALEGVLRAGGLLRRQADVGLTLFVSARGSRIRFRDLSADTLHLSDLEMYGLGDSLGVSGSLWFGRADVAGFALQEGELAVDYAGNGGSLEFAVASAGDAAASGRVRTTFVADTTTVDVDSLVLRSGSSQWRLTNPSRLRFGETGEIEVRALNLVSATGRIEAEGSIGVAGPVSFTVNVSGVDLSEIAKAVPGDLGIAGILEVHAELSGRTRNPSLQASFQVLGGEILGASFSRFVGTGGYADGDLSVEVSMEREGSDLFRLEGRFPLDVQLPGFALSLPSRAIRMQFVGDSIPLSLVGLVSDQITDLGGYARADVQIRGDPTDVSLVGQVHLFNGSIRILSTGIRYQELSGTLLFRGQTVEFSDVTLRGADDGRGEVVGTIEISDLNRPGFSLELRADQLPVYDRSDARLAVSGRAKLTGPYDAPVVQGNLSVVRGVLFIEELGRRSEIIDPFEEQFALIDTLFGSEPVTRRAGRNVFMDNLSVNLDISVERNTWLRSEDTNVEITGNLRVEMQRAQQDYRIDGTLSAVRGDYRFLNRRFEVVEGTVEFVGTPGMNPNLHIVARTRVPSRTQPIVIRAIIEGTLEDPKLRLESESQPPISESDLVSYLLFGRPTYEITRGGGADGSLLGGVAAGVPQAFFGYALESLLISETGIDYVDVTRAQTVGEGSSSGGGLTPALAATQVEIGWYLAPRVFVSVAQRLIGEIKPTVRVEWRLTDNLTVEGVTEPRFGEELALSQAATSAFEQSFGLFLFYGWSY